MAVPHVTVAMCSGQHKREWQKESALMQSEPGHTELHLFMHCISVGFLPFPCTSSQICCHCEVKDCCAVVGIDMMSQVGTAQPHVTMPQLIMLPAGDNITAVLHSRQNLALA